MTFGKPTALIAAIAALPLVACDKSPVTEGANETAANDTATTHSSDPVESALAAAPAGVAKAAAVVSMNPDGSMNVLREGTNGFTCMPDNPATPGPDPMCMDENAKKWVAAWLGKTEPPANNVGLMYMLSGGTDFSNTDPYDKDPSDGKWVKTGPHLMVVGAPSLTAIYKGGESPDTAAPYVMWEGTPYAHVMIPVK